MKRINKYIQYSILIIIPLVFILWGISFQRARYANDPDYIYLVNALNLCQLKTVGHIDNPGTTVMESGAAILTVAHLFTERHEDIQVAVLSDPDPYVGMIRIVWIIMNGLLLFLVGRMVLNKTLNLWLALLIQSTPFLSVNLLEHVWTKVSPEPVLFFTISLLIILLFLFIHSKNQRSFRFVLAFALLSGFGLATKATFLPILAIPLILLPGLKRKALYFLLTAASFAVFTLPAWTEYRHMFRWFYGLTIHTGIYGYGEKGFIDTGQYLENLVKILTVNPFLTVVTFLGLLLIGWGMFTGKNGNNTRRVLIALTVCNVLGILMVAKHYHANHYLLPELALTGMTLYALLVNLWKEFSSEKPTKTGNPVLLALIILLFLVFYLPVMKQKDYMYRITNEEYEAMHAMISIQYPDYQQAYYYPGSLNKYSALRFGNVYAKGKQLNGLKQVYPSVIFFDNRTFLFYNWEAEMILADVLGIYGNKWLLVGGPVHGSARDEIVRNGLPLKEIFRGRTQALYELDTLSLKPLLDSLSQPPLLEILCQADTLSADGSAFLSGVNLFGGGTRQSSEASRSGRFSAKLDQEHPFALDISLSGVMPGEQYRISVWRLAQGNKGHLVATTDNPDLLYRSANDHVATDPDGWKRINLYVTIPESFEGQPLKIYVWNSGEEPVYFDDLQIIRIR